MSDDKPTMREWWLPLTTLIVNSDPNRPNGTHVIEKSAYNELKAELDYATTCTVNAEAKLHEALDEREFFISEADYAILRLKEAEARIKELEAILGEME